MIRLFVGLSIPAETRTELARLGGGLPGARWLPPENYHLTLRFVGNVGHDVAEDIDAALTRIDSEGFEVTLEGLGWFGSRKHGANSIFAKARKTPPLVHLHRKVESAVVRAGLERSDRKFTPHVTLARLKGADQWSVEKYCADHEIFSLPPFRVDRFVLFSSFLSQSGAIYTAEAEYPLRESVTV